MRDWANSRLGLSVSDLYRAKIKLGELKAVYINYFDKRGAQRVTYRAPE